MKTEDIGSLIEAEKLEATYREEINSSLQERKECELLLWAIVKTYGEIRISLDTIRSVGDHPVLQRTFDDSTEQIVFSLVKEDLCSG